MSKSKRTTKNSLKVWNYEQQELLYQNILQESLKPSVLMKKKLAEMSQENQNSASTSMEGNEVHADDITAEKPPGETPAVK